MPALLRVLSWIHPAYRRLLRRPIASLFFLDLVGHTRNFSTVKWMGQPIWQNVFDLWTIQETLVQIKPALLIECGTNRGGSALFYAHLFDLLGHGRIITVDVERMHAIEHQRVTWLQGSSVSPEVLATMRQAAAAAVGPVLVILDSDHRRDHVAQELDAYAPLITSGSYLLVQDGVIDTLPAFRHGRPGPLPAIRAFLERHPEFTVDIDRSERFLITHHPMGWLRKR